MWYSGLLFLRRLFSSKHEARILVYHSISEDPLNPFSVSPGDFEAQVRFLVQHFNVIPLAELAACLNEGREIPPDSVVITLDDGFKDNYTHAYPTLKKYDVPATMFLIVDRIEADGSFPPELEEQGSGLYLSWSEIEEMSTNGISLGSHTLSHDSLAGLTLGEAKREIQESKRRLEERLSQTVELFSYPYGTVRDFNEDVKTLVAESGYTCACVGLNGTSRRDTDPYLLRRTKIEVGDGMYVFEKAMRGGLDVFILLDRVRQLLPRKVLPALNSQR
jgi:peptidoglycan/xylan/chitin deacetylase (PgdA/CDA1 family)